MQPQQVQVPEDHLRGPLPRDRLQPGPHVLAAGAPPAAVSDLGVCDGGGHEREAEQACDWPAERGERQELGGRALGPDGPLGPAARGPVAPPAALRPGGTLGLHGHFYCFISSLEP